MKDATSDSSDLDLSADVISSPTNVQYSDNIGIQLNWAGTSPSGQISIEISNNYNPLTKIGTWTALDFGSPILIATNSGSHLININLVPFAWVRLSYSATSGSGTLVATLVMKQVGG